MKAARSQALKGGLAAFKRWQSQTWYKFPGRAWERSVLWGFNPFFIYKKRHF